MFGMNQAEWFVYPKYIWTGHGRLIRTTWPNCSFSRAHSYLCNTLGIGTGQWIHQRTPFIMSPSEFITKKPSWLVLARVDDQHWMSVIELTTLCACLHHRWSSSWKFPEWLVLVLFTSRSPDVVVTDEGLSILSSAALNNKNNSEFRPLCGQLLNLLCLFSQIPSVVKSTN